MEYKLFTEYYTKLLRILPAGHLSHYFVSDKIITLEDHENVIKSSSSQEAAKLLLDKVLLQLQGDNSTVFNKMLLIMDHHGVTDSKALSLEIRTKLSETSKHKHGNYRCLYM